MLMLTQGKGTLQRQALELHHALALPPESDAYLLAMFPNSQPLKNLAAVAAYLHEHKHQTGPLFSFYPGER
jgi:hypothetical protein